MKKAEKAKKIHRILGRLYPQPQAPLRHEDPYSLLIAVLLSAQSTDKKVNEITPQLFALAKDPASMTRLSVETIKEKIRQIGLFNTKAKNIHRLSKILVDKHNAQVPRSFEDLEALPGVGHKTASVVMSQAFGVPAFPVDTHIHRLAWRWGLSDRSSVERTEKDLKRLYLEKCWNDLHLQIIFFGREYCPARGHDIQNCPICSWAGVKSRLRLEEQKTGRKKK